MAANQNDTRAQGAKRNARNQSKAAPRGAPQDAVTPQATAPQAAPKKAAGRKKAAPKRTSRKAAPKRQVPDEERHHMIEEAAYFEAEKQGFSCDPWRCWLDAEAEIDARLASSR